MSDVDTEAPTGVAAPESPLADPAPEAPETPPEPDKTAAEALRRAAEAERRANRLEAQAKKRDEEEAAKQGEWQKLAEQRQAELEQTREQVQRNEREARITRLAAKAKFIDPADVIGKVSAEDATDDASVEAALEQIADRSPHLIAKDPPATPEIGQVLSPSAQGAPQGDGRPSPPPGRAPLMSLEDAEALPQAELVARMDEVEWLERSQK